MIKFFRSIRQNLINEGKTTKYFKYAIGEIVLVVIGILIALQINNWNESRKEALEEQKILHAIEKGFEFNKIEVNQNMEETSRTITGTSDVLQLFELTNDQLTSKKCDSLLRKMYAYSTFHPSDGALNDLISAGRLNIITNDTLKDHLSNWNSLVIDVTEDETFLLNFINTYVAPILFKHISNNPNTKFERSSVELFSNPEFENIVFRLQRMATYQESLYESLEKEIDLILQMVRTQKNEMYE